MRPSRRRHRLDRVPRFESVEPRICLSANPATVDPAPAAHLDYFVEDLLNEGVHTTLADAHDLTGLDVARAEYGFTGMGQTVVVIDTGIAYDHVALGGGFGSGVRVVGGFDFTAERDADPYDDGPFGSHGTHVAGIIGSSDSTNPGVAPGVDLVALRVFDDYGNSEFAWVEEALQWVHTYRNAFENPITTVNLSLGTNWNSSALPDWATFEDELAQLEADGIFTAVAAGNSFTRYETTGLSYPAASPYVVPVASVDDDGTLSYFTQRDRRVIAAPGRSVQSTVPDYVGDGDGRTDDFARYSGSSMASPYVAGAAVLIRQAYEFAGVPNVSQDTIYNLMVSTADTVYDPITAQSYHRLNLGRAIDTVMPADDFGSTQATAYPLGTIVDTASISGTVGSLDDDDWFRFTAAATGSVTVQARADGDLVPQWQLSGATRSPAGGDVLSFNVIAGQTYNLGLATGDGLGHYTLEFNLEPDTSYLDWGTVRQQRRDGNRIDAAGQWFAVTAAADGVLTTEAFFAPGDANVDLKLFDAGHVLVAGSYGAGSYERIDVSARAGETFYLHAYARSGASDRVDFRVTNLLARNGEAVHVLGTAGDDSFLFSTAATHRITVNGVLYQFDSAAVRSVTFDGLGGSDRAEIHGTDGDDVVVLRAGSAELDGPGYQVRTIRVEAALVHGQGGSDRASFYDSAGDDTFIASPLAGRMFGTGFDHRVQGFDQIEGFATGGGTDVARLYDSAGNDDFVANLVAGRLSGVGFSNRARFFEQLHAYATAGGLDVAKLFDSPGNDTFVAGPAGGTLYGDGFLTEARSFDGLHAYATAGGNDVARLSGSAGNDILVVTSTHGALFGAGYYNRAKFFEEIHADGQSGGNDSGGNDSGGNDKAYLYDSTVDDYFQASGSGAQLRNELTVTWLDGFEYVRAIATGGGANHAEVAAVDYLLELDGNWS